MVALSVCVRLGASRFESELKKGLLGSGLGFKLVIGSLLCVGLGALKFES